MVLDYLDSRQAAEKLHISWHTLRRWRQKRKGPDYARIGRQVLYSNQTIDEFFKKQVEARR